MVVNLSYFIAKRLATSKEYKSSVSAPIIKIASIAVAISVVMMLVAVATGFGLQRKIRDKISAFQGHISLINYDNNQSDVSMVPIVLDEVVLSRIKENPQIKTISPIASKAGVIRTEETFEGIIYKGVTKDFDWEQISDYLVEGTLPDLSKEDMSNQVLISSYMANRLHKKVGDKIQTYFLKQQVEGMPNIRGFEIAGIYNSGFQEFDQAFVLGDLRQVQRLNKWHANEVGAYDIFIKDFDKIDAVNTEIYEQLPSDVDSVAVSEKYLNIFEWLAIFDFNIYVILVIMIIVSVINMIVALLVLILERTQMIGMLKALGANNWVIRKIFLLNATHVILKGLLWGNLVGISMLLVQHYFGVIILDPSQYHVKVAPVYLSPLYIIAINIALILICYLVLLIPSHIISKISPVKVLKFE